jgi:hypothetical protein
MIGISGEINLFYNNISTYTLQRKSELDAHEQLKEVQLDAFLLTKETQINEQIETAYNEVNASAIQMATRAKMREFGII